MSDSYIDRINQPLDSAQLKQRIAELEAEKVEMDQLFESRWKADMRGIAKWRNGRPDRDLKQPDHADLVCFLAEQTEALEAELAQHAKDCRPTIERLEGELREAQRQLASTFEMYEIASQAKAHEEPIPTHHLKLIGENERLASQLQDAARQLSLVEQQSSMGWAQEEQQKNLAAHFKRMAESLIAQLQVSNEALGQIMESACTRSSHFEVAKAALAERDRFRIFNG